MTRSRPLRRFVAIFACAVCLLVPQTLVLALGRSPLLAGEEGSGPPPRLPHTLERGDGVKWIDVPKDLWARAAIDFVAGENEWMRDFRAAADGTYPFWPDRLETRRLFARAVVRAFAPDAVPDPTLKFRDLSSDDRLFRFANVAVSQGWMQVDADGDFLPTEPVTVRMVHRAVVLALGMGDLAAGADALHLHNGTRIPTPEGFGTLLIGMLLGLRYNHGDESLDVGPDSPLSRAEVAWSLYRAATEPDWMGSALAPYATIELPNLSEKMQQVVTFGVRYVGYPYVWGGEWFQATPEGYCCGFQPTGGFDCSGLTWWLMKAADAGWDNTPPREYLGWMLPQRSSAQMAAVGGKVKWEGLQPGDLMFYDGDGDGTVDHVDTYIGNGWALDSGSSNGGVTITRVEGTWYQDHFVKGRRILG
jgi:NlpC/P60 family